MYRVEIYINNNNSLEIHSFKNTNDEYPSRVYKGSECYNFIKILSGHSIQNIKKGTECLVLEYNGLVINLDNFGEIIKKRGMGPLANSIKKYYETKKLMQTPIKKVKRKNKHVGLKVVAGTLVLFILGTVVYNHFKKKTQSVDIKSDIKNEYVIEKEKFESDYKEDSSILKEVIEQGESIEIDEAKESEKTIIVSIDYEDRSEEDKVRITNSYYSNLINENAAIYGLDSNLVLAIATQERGIHSESRDSGGATGLMQLQNSVWENKKITAYNFETNSYETVYITREKIQQLHTNIQIGCMYLQNCMKYMNYNIIAAVQCYNMGKGNMDTILEAYSKDSNKSVEDILNDKYDIGWLDYRNIVKEGDPIYIENVFSWLGPDFEITVKKNDNSIVTSNISNEFNAKKIC